MRERFAFHDACAARRTFSKSQPGISAATFLRAPSSLTPEIPVFTEITSLSPVWKCSKHFRDVPLASRTDGSRGLLSETISAETNGFENFRGKKILRPR